MLTKTKSMYLFSRRKFNYNQSGYILHCLGYTRVQLKRQFCSNRFHIKFISTQNFKRISYETRRRNTQDK